MATVRADKGERQMLDTTRAEASWRCTPCSGSGVSGYVSSFTTMSGLSCCRISASTRRWLRRAQTRLLAAYVALEEGASAREESGACWSVPPPMLRTEGVTGEKLPPSSLEASVRLSSVIFVEEEEAVSRSSTSSSRPTIPPEAERVFTSTFPGDCLAGDAVVL
jgi:hypothetical protein